MSRGKEAARNANRRAAECEQKMLDLRAQLNEQRSTHAREIADLKAQLQQASNRLTREVDLRAAAAIEFAESAARSAVAAAEARADERIYRGAGEMLAQLGYVGAPSPPKGKWLAIAKAFEVPAGELLSRTGCAGGREVRRLTNKRLRDWVVLEQDVKASRRPPQAPRVTHNPHLPPWHEPREVVLDERYEREVQRASSKGERAFARAQRRVEQAERRLARASSDVRAKRMARHIADLQSAVVARRAELAELERLMTAAPAGAKHRGVDSYRKVPR